MLILTRKRHNEKEKLEINIVGEHRLKVQLKMLANEKISPLQSLLHPWYAGISKLKQVKANGIGDKSHSNYLKRSRKKAFEKIQYAFWINVLESVGLEGIYFNISKAIYEKPTVNIILSEEKLETITPKSGMRWSDYPHYFTILCLKY